MDEPIKVTLEPAVFGENTITYISSSSFHAAMEWQKQEEKREVGEYEVPVDTEKYVIISDRWNTESRYATYKATVLRNTDKQAKIKGFSIHHCHRSGESDNQVVIDFDNESSVREFTDLCSSTKDLLCLSKTHSALIDTWILKKEQYKTQPLSYCIVFKDNPPCTYDGNGGYKINYKKLNHILDLIHRVDAIDQKTMKTLHSFYDIPGELYP